MARRRPPVQRTPQADALEALGHAIGRLSAEAQAAIMRGFARARREAVAVTASPTLGMAALAAAERTVSAVHPAEARIAVKRLRSRRQRRGTQ